MRRALSLRLIAGLAVASMTLAACGSSNTGSTTTTTPPPATSQQDTSAAAPSETTDTAAATDTGSPAATDTGSPAATDTGSPAGSAAPSSAAGPQMTGDKSKVKVGLAYDVGGRGDQSFNDSAARGLDKAKGEGVAIAGELEATLGEPDSAKTDRLNQLVSAGANTIVAVGFAYAGPLEPVAVAHPEVHFAIVDDDSLCAADHKGGPLKNVACLTFAAEQSSFLVGVAAALKSKSGSVGFIGGVDVPLIQTFQAGFDAGVKAAKPDVKITDKYISEPPDMGGFNDPKSGETIAKGMYDNGTDIIYAAAGGSGAGVFKAAKAAGKLGIGVDSDQYNQKALADVKDVIMTSAVKNVDVAVFDFIASAVNGAPLTGVHHYDLKNGGVAVATSGGMIDDIMPQIDAYRAKIISGEITVPTKLGS